MACSYTQVLDVDFGERFAPAISNVSFRIMFITKLIWGLQASIIDAETTFLHGNIQEDIYVNTSQGMESNNNECQ